MKKSALLAVSALSLGLVGLSTFVPAVNAKVANSPVSTDATITVKVNAQLGIGAKQAADDDTPDLDVTVPALGANAISKSDAGEKGGKIYTTNNTGASAYLTIKDADEITDMVGKTATNKIATNADVKKGTSAWGYSTDGGSTFKAVTTSPTLLKQVKDGEDSQEIVYGVSTDATQHADTYEDTVTYTVTTTNPSN